MEDSQDTNNEDPTPKLKSSPIPILFIPFNNKDNKCNYCGNKYSKTLLFSQRYCKKCLFKFIKDTIGDNATYLDVHISKNKTRCIEHEADLCTGNIQEWCKHCSEISYFKQVISPLSFPKYKKEIEKLTIKCDCGESVYHSETSYVDFLISFGQVESFLTKKLIPILYLPWWDAKGICIVCKRFLKLVSNCQKSCSHCYTTFIGCRYCLTTNIIFGITEESQCKKCNRTTTIDTNIPNIGSGNYDVDEFLYYTRFNTNNYHAISNYINYYNKNQVWFYNFIENELVNNIQPIMELIPYTQIKDFKEIARGGFGIVYKATWLKENKEVAVKKFFSQNIKTFLNELKSLYQCYDKNFIIKYCGITQDTESKDYMLVMEYANGKNLHNYLRENFTNITWHDKINLLLKISEGLCVIHEKNFIHRDFHSKNIFLSESDSYQHWQIGDLGLTRHANDILSNNEMYGIISYTAPEIFKYNKYLKESDIYSMGMIMWELTTGRRPFDNVKNDVTLILEIIDGKRPEITNDTPKCFSNLMKRCLDSNPTKRPSANEIYEISYFWLFRNEDIEQFNEAEKRRLELLELKKLGPEFTENSNSGLIYTNFTINLLQSNIKPNSLTKRSNIKGYFTRELDFDIDDIQSRSSNINATTTSRSLVPHTNNTNNNGDPTPKLKSSPVPILFIAFNNEENECINCGNEYFKTLLSEQKYCNNCLNTYVQQITDINTYMDVHISENNTRYISKISHFKQIVSPLSSPKYTEEKVEESCKLCGNIVYQSISYINYIFCPDCFLISCEWIDSSLTKKPIPILCLPWWDVSYDCITCGRYLKFISDHQKLCSNCFIIYIGCRYCLTTNIIFGIADKSQCKKCKRIVFTTADIANTTSGNYDIDVLLGLDTNKFHMLASFNKYIDNKVLNSLQIYEFIRDKFGDKYNPITKWFSYPQINNVKEIAEGGFSIIYIANVVDYGPVILKRYRDSLDGSKHFLNDLKLYSQLYSRFDAIIKLYGVTQDPNFNDNMLVMEYANGGNLHGYLQKNFANITWMDKLIILQNISEGLHSIHKKNVIHRDFHSGNILLKYSDSRNLWKIGDFNLSQHTNSTLTSNEIYGVIPYIAPEIFKGSQFSKGADIYSMGMIMWELTTGCKPFANVELNADLVYKILDGERPLITEDTPEIYANLMKRCWNSDPNKRPLIFEILESVSWYNYDYTTKFAVFKQAEERRLELIEMKMLGPDFSEKRHSGAIYTSRLLSALISKDSLEFSINAFNEKQGYTSQELNFNNDNESQNNDYNSVELKSNEDIFQISSLENNDFAKDSTQQGTSISTSRKHNIEESNIQPQNDGKRIKAEYVG
ncbi:Bck1p [Rhizophagus irregularis DAOM 197198w]|uniref:Bck1p n=2 Tax=Rhizophagus irregularis TaxID=588596 RepID=A0A015I3Y4_RHIIW|nr:Bck1p [Rhizophagus irregularis DAOM 197198w]